MDKLELNAIALLALVAGWVPSAHGQETRAFSYDALGRLMQVSSSGSVNNGINTTYCYDDASNRKSVKANGVGAASPASAYRCSNASNGTDFNGDSISDILWRSSSGDVSNWLGTSTGGFTNNDANALTIVGTDWKVVGTGDFNGDGRDDILWRSSAGWLSDWLGKPSGGFVVNDSNALVLIGLDWKVVGTGDFDGDGRSDVLWRRTTGELTDKLGQANGSFADNDANALQTVPTAWKVAGTGDINGDHRDDIVWRNDSGEFSVWLGQPNGGFVSNGAIAGAMVSNSWKIVGVADFNGDGRSDVLWRSDTGGTINWLGTSAGGFVDNSANCSYSVDLSWSVVGVNDYNGDGLSDILWRQNSGTLSDWLGTQVGGFTNNDANASTSVATNWYVQGPSTF